MAGIYIHVPFCKKKCLYCDFYSVGATNKISNFPSLIEKELMLRSSFIANERIDTIYFGGGTPSLLQPQQVAQILNSIAKKYPISEDSEITIEVNPDDVSEELLKGYRTEGINRISIGVQSFIDSELLFLGRRHDANAALQSIDFALNAGLSNISIDLIYGIPNSTIESWDSNLRKAFSLDIKHLSCYHLTYENGTPLTRKLKEKKIQEVEDSISVQQFDLLRDRAGENGFIHYEVSNLAKEGFYSRHNTAYWKGINYLGLGPAAHSFNGLKREWNPSSYINWETGIESQKPATQSENIDKLTKFNEILLTHLRTIWGVNLDKLKDEFEGTLMNELRQNAKPFLDAKKLVIIDNHLLIPPEYFFISDGIIGELILVND
jgi:oxygen-independent coproporphyrinogen III oxidase